MSSHRAGQVEEGIDVITQGGSGRSNLRKR